jgi:hypothetical protein
MQACHVPNWCVLWFAAASTIMGRAELSRFIGWFPVCRGMFMVNEEFTMFDRGSEKVSNMPK